MVAEIVIGGVGPNAPPGVYGVVNFAQGQGTSGQGVYDVLILANIGPANNVGGAVTPTLGVAGTLYGPDTSIALQSSTDAFNILGDGYAANLMWTDYNKINPNGNRVYVMPVAMASGSAATFVLTLTTSSAPQTAGLINVVIGTDVVAVPFGSADTVSTIATNVVSFVNGNTHLPCVASANMGVVTFTVKSVSSRSNWLRIGCTVVTGTGVLVNGSTATGRQNFTSGAGSDLAGYTTCINNLIAANRRFYTVISEAGGDSVDSTTNAITSAIMSNLIDFEAQGSIGIRQVLFQGTVDIESNSIAVTRAINDPRYVNVGQYQNDVQPCRIAARVAAGFNVFQTPFLQADGVNLNGFGSNTLTQPFYNIPAPLNGSAPSPTDVANAVVSGRTILKVLPGNRTCVVKACTSHFWTGTNAQFDPRIVDFGKVVICDYFLDDVENALALAIVGKLIGDDPPTGVVGANIFTPNKARTIVQQVMAQYAGLINVTSTNAGLVVQRGTVPTNRIEVQIPLFTDDLVNTVVIQVNQVS
jgi:phage tail sheath gpL-like